jgi:hypothetical protein
MELRGTNEHMEDGCIRNGCISRLRLCQSIRYNVHTAALALSSRLDARSLRTIDLFGYSMA